MPKNIERTTLDEYLKPFLLVHQSLFRSDRAKIEINFPRLSKKHPPPSSSLDWVSLSFEYRWGLISRSRPFSRGKHNGILENEIWKQLLDKPAARKESSKTRSQIVQEKGRRGGRNYRVIRISNYRGIKPRDKTATLIKIRRKERARHPLFNKPFSYRCQRNLL